MRRRGKQVGIWAGALSAAALLVLPAVATARLNAKRPPAISLSFDRVGSFTPATADPKLAAAFANRFQKRLHHIIRYEAIRLEG